MITKEMIENEKGYYAKHFAMDHSLKTNAQNLLWEFNNTRPDESEKRASILQKLFGTCSPITFIEPNFKCDYGFNIHTHGFAFINYNCVMLDTSPINIGENAFIGPGTCLSCAGHPIYPSERIVEGISTSKPITIENDVWIGANCTVFGGVTIGAGTVIGGGSVVTKDIPDWSIAAGNPCRVIRKITDEDRRKLFHNEEIDDEAWDMICAQAEK